MDRWRTVAIAAKTEPALKSFEKVENLRESGRGDAQTLSKLGVQ